MRGAEKQEENMKKIIALLLVLTMTVTVFAGCGDKYADAEVQPAVTETVQNVSLDVPDGFEKTESVVEDYKDQGLEKTETVYKYTESAFDSIIVTELTTSDTEKMKASVYADYIIKELLVSFDGYEMKKLSTGKDAYVVKNTDDKGLTTYNAYFKPAADKVVAIEFKGNAKQKDNSKMEAAFDEMLESIAATK